VQMFGSSASGLHTCGADLDLCLIPPRPPHINAARRMIESLGEELKRRGMLEVLPLPSARVPIVKFVDARSGLHCDICVNNELALHNTRLLRTYAHLDPRVRPLIAVVKYWASQRKINEPFKGTLSSYAYVMLVLNFLQTCSPPVLPCLQALGRREADERTADGYDVWFQDDPEKVRTLFRARANESSLGALLAGFFTRYATEFDVDKHVVSVREARLMPREEKVWGSSLTSAARKGRKADRHLFCIEDPFEVSHDLGRVMDSTSIVWVQDELARAHDLLSQGKSLAEVCSPWSEEEEAAEAAAVSQAAEAVAGREGRATPPGGAKGGGGGKGGGDGGGPAPRMQQGANATAGQGRGKNVGAKDGGRAAPDGKAQGNGMQSKHQGLPPGGETGLEAGALAAAAAAEMRALEARMAAASVQGGGGTGPLARAVAAAAAQSQHEGDGDDSGELGDEATAQLPSGLI